MSTADPSSLRREMPEIMMEVGAAKGPPRASRPSNLPTVAAVAQATSPPDGEGAKELLRLIGATFNSESQSWFVDCCGSGASQDEKKTSPPEQKQEEHLPKITILETGPCCNESGKEVACTEWHKWQTGFRLCVVTDCKGTTVKEVPVFEWVKIKWITEWFTRDPIANDIEPASAGASLCGPWFFEERVIINQQVKTETLCFDFICGKPTTGPKKTETKEVKKVKVKIKRAWIVDRKPFDPNATPPKSA